MTLEQALKAHIILKNKWLRHPWQTLLLKVNYSEIDGLVELSTVKERRNKNYGLAYTWFHMICWHYPYTEVALLDRRKGKSSQVDRFPSSSVWLFTMPEEKWPETQVYGLTVSVTSTWLNMLMKNMALLAGRDIIPWLITDFTSVNLQFHDMPGYLVPPCIFLRYSPLWNAFQLPSSISTLLFFQDLDQPVTFSIKSFLAYYLYPFKALSFPLTHKFSTYTVRDLWITFINFDGKKILTFFLLLSN